MSFSSIIKVTASILNLIHLTKALVTAVKDGDQDLVTKLLAKPAADINMSWVAFI